MFRTFWNALKEDIPGKEDEKKPNEYHTEEFGTIYRNTITGFLIDRLGAETEHARDGNILVFDPLVIEKLAKTDKTRITVKELHNDNVQDRESYNNNNDNHNTKKEEENDKNKKQLREGVKAVSAHDREASEIVDVKRNTETQNKLLKSRSNDDSITHNQIDSLLVINEDQYREKNSITPSSYAFTALTPSPSRNSIIINREEFDNPLISESDLISDYNYNPKIINNICRFEGSDRWFCKMCTIKGDKWFMMKHPCKS